MNNWLRNISKKSLIPLTVSGKIPKSLRFHLSWVKRYKFKKTTDNKCWLGSREGASTLPVKFANLEGHSGSQCEDLSKKWK